MVQRSPDSFLVLFWLVVDFDFFFFFSPLSERGHGEKMPQIIFTALLFHGDLTSVCENLISHFQWIRWGNCWCSKAENWQKGGHSWIGSIIARFWMVNKRHSFLTEKRSLECSHSPLVLKGCVNHKCFLQRCEYPWFCSCCMNWAGISSPTKSRVIIRESWGGQILLFSFSWPFIDDSSKAVIPKQQVCNF